MTTANLNLKSILKEKRITLRKLSTLTGISTQALSNIKNGKTKRIELQTIGLLAKALDCSPNDLIKVDDDRH